MDTVLGVNPKPVPGEKLVFLGGRSIELVKDTWLVLNGNTGATIRHLD